MHIAAKMMEPEFGFLFQKDSQFEAGMAAWGKKRPASYSIAEPTIITGWPSLFMRLAIKATRAKRSNER